MKNEFSSGTRVGESRMNGMSETGVRAASPRVELSFSPGRILTVFQAEMQVINACLVQNKVGTVEKRNTCISCDSRAVLWALDSSKFESKLMWDCFYSLM
jgi:hypothetical protein